MISVCVAVDLWVSLGVVLGSGVAIWVAAIGATTVRRALVSGPETAVEQSEPSGSVVGNVPLATRKQLRPRRNALRCGRSRRYHESMCRVRCQNRHVAVDARALVSRADSRQTGARTRRGTYFLADSPK